MKKHSKFNAGMALGSLTAAVALLAGMSIASAQTTAGASDDSVSGQAAAGGGSFPGSFLVPGTNTSIKIGGFAKGQFNFDHSAVNGDTVAESGIPLDGSAAHSLHGATRIQARQSNFDFDVRTPTAWGELDVFIQTDFFGNQPSAFPRDANTQNARMTLAYGTLGPVLVGQGLTLFFDGDAIGESVDPTISLGVNNGLTNRQPQIRYTWVGAGGLSLAASAEQPAWEVGDTTTALTGVNFIGGQTAGTINRYPDFIVKGRWDQAWGHVALAGVVRDQITLGIGTARTSKTGWGGNLTGHINTFGKDTLRFGAIAGQAIGHYLSDIGISGFAGLQETSVLATGAPNEVAKPFAYGLHLDYTHWWTNQLRSTILAGYEHLNIANGIFTTAALRNAVPRYLIEGTLNLVWSPVPQVDFGIEYTWGQKTTWASTAAVSNTGYLNRTAVMGVFKF
jgi:hypothetical protein